MERRGGFHGFHCSFPFLSLLLLALGACSCLFKNPVGRAQFVPSFYRDFLHHCHEEQQRTMESWNPGMVCVGSFKIISFPAMGRHTLPYSSLFQASCNLALDTSNKSSASLSGG